MSNTPVLSKEEILCKHLDAEGTFYDLGKEHGYIDGPITPIFPAMEEYARQESIEFAKWLKNILVGPKRGGNSIEELYEMYLTEKEK